MARLRNADGVTVDVPEGKVKNVTRRGFSAVEDAPAAKQAPAKKTPAKKAATSSTTEK